jgi:hypothetical protein
MSLIKPPGPMTTHFTFSITGPVGPDYTQINGD